MGCALLRWIKKIGILLPVIFSAENEHNYLKRKNMYFVYSHIDKSVKSAKFGLLKSIFNIHIKKHQSLSESHFCLTISNLILTCFNVLTV